MTGHQCPAPGCETVVPSSQFACRYHWFSIPKPLRDAVWAGWREQPLGDAHLIAMENADAYLQSAAEEVPGARD